MIRQILIAALACSFGAPTSAQVVSVLADLPPSIGTGQRNALTPVSGIYYFTCQTGGTNNHGTIAAYVPGAGVFKVYDLLGPATGKFPLDGMTLHGNNLYFTCSEGGSGDAGTLSKFDLVSGVASIVFNLQGFASYPLGTPFVTGGGVFITALNSSTGGAVLRFDLTTGFVATYSLGAATGVNPHGGFVAVGADLWFTCNFGLTGLTTSGTVAEIDASSGVVSNVANLSSLGVSSPRGDLAMSGNIAYFTADGGGANGTGALLIVNTTTGALTKVVDFGAGCGNPGASTPAIANGFVFTTSQSGGIGLGSLNLTNSTVQPIVSFSSALGNYPSPNLLLSGSSMIVLTNDGGTNGTGAVLSVTIPAAAGVSAVGVGCGLGGPTVLALSQPPRIGQNSTATFSGAAAFAPGAFVVSGPTAADIPIGNGCTIYVDPSSMFVLTNFLTSPFGASAMVFPFPALPVLAGLSLRMQAASFPSPGGVAMVELSNGLELLLGY